MASGSAPIQDTSPPEQKALPSPVTTTARTSGSARSPAITRPQEAVIGPDIMFRRSGRSRVTRTTPDEGRDTRRSASPTSYGGPSEAPVGGLGGGFSGSVMGRAYSGVLHARTPRLPRSGWSLL